MKCLLKFRFEQRLQGGSRYVVRTIVVKKNFVLEDSDRIRNDILFMLESELPDNVSYDDIIKAVMDESGFEWEFIDPESRYLMKCYTISFSDLYMDKKAAQAEIKSGLNGCCYNETDYTESFINI